MRRREFVISAGAAMTAVSALSSPLGAAFAQEAPGTAPEAAVEPVEEPAAKPFDFEDVAALAKELADKPYEYRDAELIGTFGNLTYDQYRGIRFRSDRDPWAGSRDFALDLLPPGAIFHPQPAAAAWPWPSDVANGR